MTKRICLILALVGSGYFPLIAATVPEKIAGYAMVPLGVAEKNHLLIPVSIKGEKLLLLVDSGAQVSGIDQETVGKLALLPPAKETGLPRQIRMNGQWVKVAWLPDLQSGGMKFGGGPMAVIPAGVLSEMEYKHRPGQVHGLLGLDLLRRHQAVLNCHTAQIFFKTDQRKTRDFSHVLLRAGYRSVPLKENRGHLLVPVRFHSQECFITIDTGSWITLIQEKRLRDLGIHPQMTGADVRGINIPSTRLGIVAAADHQMTIAGISVAESVGVTQSSVLVDQYGTPTLGLLGLDILGLHGAIIDFDTMTLYFHERTGAGKK